MDLNSSTLQDQLQESAQAHITPGLHQRLEGHVQLIEEVQKSLHQYQERTHSGGKPIGILELVREMKSFKDAITQSVNQYTSVDPDKSLREDFSEYFEALAVITEQLPETYMGVQSTSHFVVSAGDRFFLRLGKAVKRILLRLDHIPQRILNWWRRLRKQPSQPMRPWKRLIPQKNMVIWFYRDVLFQEMQKTLGSVYRTVATSSHELWKLESKLDQDFEHLNLEDPGHKVEAPTFDFDDQITQMLDEIREQQNTLLSKVNYAFDRVSENYLRHHQLVGTLDLPEKAYSVARLERFQKATEKSYSKVRKGWSNTIAVLSDHYNLDQELYQLRYACLEQYFYTAQKLDLKVSEKIEGALSEITDFVGTQKGRLDQAEDGQCLAKVIKEVRYDIAKSLKTSIPAATKLIFDQNIPALIDNLEVKIKNQVSELSNTRSMVKDITYERGIQSSEIDQISPRELIAFEALPNLLKDIKNLKSELVHNLEHTQQQLSEIAEICDFNLATALAAMEEAPEEDKDPKTLALEGMERAAGRLQDISEALHHLNKDTNLKIKEGVLNFNESIHALNEVETVFDIKVRIAKAKAVEKTKALKNQVLDYLKGFLPRLISLAKRRWLMINRYYLETTKRYGIAGSSQALTAEVSSFLSETDAAIDQLPFVYQRLFEITPLENPNFYELRSQETQKLLKAYQSWEKGHYGATALIGEAGSGTTTLTNFFLEQLKSRHHIVRTNSHIQIYQPADFLEYFQNLFDTEPFESLDQLVDYLNSINSKRIMVLENLQHFYLRKVNGFACLRMFYELVSRTNQNIFWLTTVNLHAYHYLNKTSQIEDFFAYNIYMEPLKDEQVTNVVVRRHRVSGYNTFFKPSKYDRKSSKYQKMTEDQRQQYLQKEYFSGLNKLAHSNITVALIFWLRSTLKVEDDTITIGSLKDMDFSFLSNLSSEKLFTLHVLLLHDGISIEDHALIFQQAEDKSKLVLILLYEDGIIIRKEERYFINPLLYRQVVNLLKSKNFLH